MRSDMARVIVERPRVLDRATRKGRSRALDALPTKLGMRRDNRERGGYKMLNENLAPLRRYLEKQVGRPWDKVYSEIAAHLRADSTVQQHVRDHIGDFVQIGAHREFPYWQPPLYVDPRDGILKRTDQHSEEKARRRREAERLSRKEVPERITLGPDWELRRIGGIWYALRLAPLPDAEYRPSFDVRRREPSPWERSKPLLGEIVAVRRLATPALIDAADGSAALAGPEIDEPEGWRDHRERYPNRRYPVAKRQLSKAELRHHGLRNVDAGNG